MDDLEFDLLYPNDEDLPDEWEMQLANAEPHNMTVYGFTGYGDDTIETAIEVEVGPNSPTKEQVFG